MKNLNAFKVGELCQIYNNGIGASFAVNDEDVYRAKDKEILMYLGYRALPQSRPQTGRAPYMWEHRFLTRTGLVVHRWLIDGHFEILWIRTCN
jgi:hypothetical protein